MSDTIRVSDFLLQDYSSNYTFLSPTLYHIINPAMQGGSPLLTDAPIPIKNEDEKRYYFARKLQGDAVEIKRYKRLIMNPIPSYQGLWPVDIVKLVKGQSNLIGHSVAHRYDAEGDDRDLKHEYALLFEYKEVPELISASRQISGLDCYGWENERIQHMGVNITKCLQKLNDSHYAFYDMHFSRFFFSENDGAFLDFSNLIYRIGDTCSPSETQYPLEFADPLYFNGTKQKCDLNTQNYSLAAMLFYLFMNKHAYDGGEIENKADNSLKHHYQKIKYFLRNPVFIFSGGCSTMDDGPWNLWNNLPQSLRGLFKEALESYLSGDEDSNVPTPAKWIEVFQELNWCE